MTNDVDIKLVGDDALLAVIKNLDYKLQHQKLKQILTDAANKTVVKELKANSPVRSGNLRRSMGVKAGKNKRSAMVFVGPRMGGKYTGYIANVIEFNKGKDRYPGKRSKRPRTPEGIRVHSGRMPTTHKGFVKKSILSKIKDAENHLAKSIRTIAEREMKKARKSGIV